MSLKIIIIFKNNSRYEDYENVRLSCNEKDKQVVLAKHSMRYSILKK